MGSPRRRRARTAPGRRLHPRGRPQLARGRPPPSRHLRESWMTAVAPQPTLTRAPARTGRVFLAGAFGQGNPGDEALLAAFARGIGDHDAVAASADAPATAAEHGIAAVGRDDTSAVAREIAPRRRRRHRRWHDLQGAAPRVRAPAASLLRRTAALAAVTRAHAQALGARRRRRRPSGRRCPQPGARDRARRRPADPARRRVGRPAGRHRRPDAVPRRRRPRVDPLARPRAAARGRRPRSWWR